MREHEQLELLAEFAVIARAGLLHLLEVLVQLLLVRPGRAVDALQHGVALVAAPIRAGDGGQLERAQPAGGGDVRSAAEIEPLALPVNRERLIAGDSFDDLDLVLFAELLERIDGLLAAPLLAADGKIAFDDLGHLCFNIS